MMIKPVHLAAAAAALLLVALLLLNRGNEKAPAVADKSAVAEESGTFKEHSGRRAEVQRLPPASAPQKGGDARPAPRTTTSAELATTDIAVIESTPETTTTVATHTSVTLQLFVRDWSTSSPVEGVHVEIRPSDDEIRQLQRDNQDTSAPRAIRFLAWLNGRNAENTNQNAEAEVRTVGKSDFLVSPLRPGTQVMLLVSAPGHVPLAVGPFPVPDGKETFQKVVRLAAVAGITGRVVQPGTKNPVAEVKYALKNTGELNWLVTAADGRFTLKDLQSGTISVGFSPKDTWPPFAREFTTVQGTTKDVGDIELVKVPAGIKGRVVRMPGEKPVPGADVRLTKRDDSAFIIDVKTDENGMFEFPNLANGTYIAWLQKPYVFQQVTLGSEDQRDLVLRVGGTKLRGHVTKNKEPVVAQVHLSQGATGFLKETALRTDADGWFEVEDVSAGWWLADIYAVANRTDKHNDWFNIPEQEVYEVEFPIPAGKVVGMVSDSQGKPVPGARVYIVKNDSGSFDIIRGAVSLETRSQADGTFALDMRNGKFAVRASKEGVGDSKPVDVEVPETGETGPVQLQLIPKDKGSIKSIALDYADGQPIKAATLNLYDATSRLEVNARRDEDGIMLVENIVPGSYRVIVSSAGYSVDEQNVDVKANETLTIESVLYEGGVARIVVQDAQGAFLPNVRVEVHPEDSRSIEQVRTGITSRGGLFLVRGLTPGGYVVKAEKKSGGMQEEKIRVRPREITDWLMVLR